MGNRLSENQERGFHETMSFETIICGYVGALLVGLVIVAWHSERLRRRFGFTPSDDSVFRCHDCGFVYTDDSDVDRSRCPHCGKANEAVTF